ncbi:MAG: GTP cyclohydrolase II [Rhodospirillales bacterium]
MTDSLPSNALADDVLLQGVARALAELRRGAPLLVNHGDQAALMQAIEVGETWGVALLSRLAGRRPSLLLTKRRAEALGLESEQDGPVALDLDTVSDEQLTALADPTATTALPAGLSALPGSALPQALAGAALDLAKLARLLPAALFVPLAPERRIMAEAEDILAVSVEAVGDYRYAGVRRLSEVTAARVPLMGAENTRIHAFRPGDGGLEHLAIVIGEIDTRVPVLVRLHSECFTGDLLGSLRCDCGEQLRGAVETIAAAGSGVLLYLAQEGRGIGLVNKLRAYRLQDRGADTLEANEQLGFDADERVYLPAAEMLRLLGVRQVRLLTNNPEKVAGLQHCGLEVTERVALSFPDNEHNRPYLKTKAQRFGHLF